MDERATELNKVVDRFSKMLDATYPGDTDPNLVRWWRCAKVAEESGEVVEALLGLSGENPRKARGDLASVEKELLDTAFAALGALAHLYGNDRTNVVSRLLGHANQTERRLRDALTTAAQDNATPVAEKE